METLIVHLKSAKKAAALKSVMDALEVKYESRKKEESPYDPGFVAKIERGRKDFRDGKGTSMTIDELKELWK